MKTAIRYFSKFGHTEKMAKIVGELTNTRPELATVRLSEPVDTLYLGSGVLLGKVDNSIVEFINTLTPDKVKNVVCFGSSAIIKSPVPQMREMLQQGASPFQRKSFHAKARWDLFTWGILTKRILTISANSFLQPSNNHLST